VPVSRRALAALAAAVLVLVPFVLPPDAFLPRALLTGFAISLAMKTRLLWVARDADPAMLATPLRFLAWLLIPPATYWPRSPAEARAQRRRAPRHLGRAAAAFVLLLVMAGAKQALPGWPGQHALGGGAAWAATAAGLAGRAVLEMLEFYLLLVALTELLTSLATLGGIQVESVFVHPARARGPGEFWSLRWNRVVHRFARHEVFAPVVRRGGRALAVLATFAASGVMHEYLVLAAVGLGAYRPGFMLAFFLLQGAAVLIERGATRRRPRPWPPLVNLGWLALTTPLFFHPLRPQIAAFDQACAAIARWLLGPLLP
jgi:hypothetical protein